MEALLPQRQSVEVLPVRKAVIKKKVELDTVESEEDSEDAHLDFLDSLNMPKRFDTNGNTRNNQNVGKNNQNVGKKRVSIADIFKETKKQQFRQKRMSMRNLNRLSRTISTSPKYLEKAPEEKLHDKLHHEHMMFHHQKSPVFINISAVLEDVSFNKEEFTTVINPYR